MDNIEQYYTAAEVAQLLRVGTRTINHWCASGRLRASKAGRSWLIAHAAVDEFLLAPKGGEAREVDVVPPQEAEIAVTPRF